MHLRLRDPGNCPGDRHGADVFRDLIVTTFAGYLHAVQFLPVVRLVSLICEVTGLDVSTGWVLRAITVNHQAIAPTTTAIVEAIIDTAVVHFDELVTTVAGRRHWFHAATTDTLSAFHADEQGRGIKAMKTFGILPRFTGVAVHDAYAAYYSDKLGVTPGKRWRMHSVVGKSLMRWLRLLPFPLARTSMPWLGSWRRWGSPTGCAWLTCTGRCGRLLSTVRWPPPRTGQGTSIV